MNNAFIWPIMIPALRYILLNVARAQIGPDKREKTGRLTLSRLRYAFRASRFGRFFSVLRQLEVRTGHPARIARRWQTAERPHLALLPFPNEMCHPFLWETQ